MYLGIINRRFKKIHFQSVLLQTAREERGSPAGSIARDVTASTACQEGSGWHRAQHSHCQAQNTPFKTCFFTLWRKFHFLVQTDHPSEQHPRQNSAPWQPQAPAPSLQLLRAELCSWGRKLSSRCAVCPNRYEPTHLWVCGDKYKEGTCH